jgi:hypothetical protein
VHNYQYDKKSKASIIHQCCQDFRVRLPEEIFSLPPYFQARPILYLADNFDNKPLRPGQPYSIWYLYSLLEDIRIDADLEVDTILQVEQASLYVQQHIPWLGTTVNNILKSGSDQEIQMLIRYLNVVVLNFPPSGLARACLFLIVAGLAHQCPEMRNILWLLLYGKAVAHAFGNPEKDCDLLAILSFAWFLSVGSPASLEGVFDDVSSQAFIKRLVFHLRSSPPKNFLNLLEHTAVKDFMSECTHSANAQSELVITSRTKGEQMFIMRTSSGISTGIAAVPTRAQLDEKLMSINTGIADMPTKTDLDRSFLKLKSSVAKLPHTAYFDDEILTLKNSINSLPVVSYLDGQFSSLSSTVKLEVESTSIKDAIKLLPTINAISHINTTITALPSLQSIKDELVTTQHFTVR